MARSATRTQKVGQGGQRGRVHSVGLVGATEQDVGVGEVLHESLFIIRSVESLPANCILGERRAASIRKTLRPILEGLCSLLWGHSRFHWRPGTCCSSRRWTY